MAARKTWRCFHCGDVLRSPKAAAAHFGFDQFQEPGCVAVLRNGESHLLDRIRDLQQQLERYHNEDSDIMRWQATKAADHAQALQREEEKGYARGLRDAARDQHGNGVTKDTPGAVANGNGGWVIDWTKREMQDDLAAFEHL